MALPLQSILRYPAAAPGLRWRGHELIDAAEFELYLKGPVRARVGDLAHEQEFAQDLAALATTEMATSTLSGVLSAVEAPLDWEVGEAIAECLLHDEFGAVWPWNENRDRKTPKASLPGADIVGFVHLEGETVFLFGEVKTSSDAQTPPGVMAGRSGLKHQIDDLGTEVRLHRSLLTWLSARCKNTDNWASYQKAAENYLSSGGKKIAIVGVLLRDTKPAELDLKSRGLALSKGAALPNIRLDAWYCPKPIKDWVSAVAQP